MKWGRVSSLLAATTALAVACSDFGSDDEPSAPLVPVELDGGAPADGLADAGPAIEGDAQAMRFCDPTGLSSRLLACADFDSTDVTFDAAVAEGPVASEIAPAAIGVEPLALITRAHADAGLTARRLVRTLSVPLLGAAESLQLDLTATVDSLGYTQPTVAASVELGSIQATSYPAPIKIIVTRASSSADLLLKLASPGALDVGRQVVVPGARLHLSLKVRVSSGEGAVGTLVLDGAEIATIRATAQSGDAFVSVGPAWAYGHLGVVKLDDARVLRVPNP